MLNVRVKTTKGFVDYNTQHDYQILSVKYVIQKTRKCCKPEGTCEGCDLAATHTDRGPLFHVPICQQSLPCTDQTVRCPQCHPPRGLVCQHCRNVNCDQCIKCERTSCLKCSQTMGPIFPGGPLDTTHYIPPAPNFQWALAEEPIQ